MVELNWTTGELYTPEAFPDADVVGAVNAFMADFTPGAFLFGDGYRIDMVEAVSSDEQARR